MLEQGKIMRLYTQYQFLAGAVQALYSVPVYFCSMAGVMQLKFH